MPELNLEDHSEEVQEILGGIPKWVIRWGVTVLFILVALVLGGSYFILYPESVAVPVRITTLNSPAPIIAKQGNNKVNEWFIMDQQPVKTGDLMAVWETEDDYLHILELEKSLSKETHESIGQLLDTLNLPSLNLEIRSYSQALKQLKAVQRSTNHLRETDRLNNQLKQKAEYLGILNKQRQVKEREFGMLKNNFKQDSIYYYDGGYGIAKRDYESALLTFLQQKSSYYQYQASIVELNNSLEDLKNELSKIKEQRDRDLTSAQVELEESLFLLTTRVEDWKTQNLLISPIDGRLDRAKFWSENQVITGGEVVGMVVPQDRIEIICTRR